MARHGGFSGLIRVGYPGLVSRLTTVLGSKEPSVMADADISQAWGTND